MQRTMSPTSIGSNRYWTECSCAKDERLWPKHVSTFYRRVPSLILRAGRTPTYSRIDRLEAHAWAKIAAFVMLNLNGKGPWFKLGTKFALAVAAVGGKQPRSHKS